MYRIHTLSRQILRPLILVVIILVVGAIVGILAWRHSSGQSSATSKTTGTVGRKSTTKPTNTVSYSTATSSDNRAGEERKNNPSNAAATLDNGSTSTNTQQGVSITITRAGKDQSGSSLQVATLISGAQSGTCTISVSKSGQAAITRTAAIEQQATSYACPVVSIPLDSFPEKGNWNVSATVHSNGQTKSTAWAANPVTL